MVSFQPQLNLECASLPVYSYVIKGWCVSKLADRHSFGSAGVADLAAHLLAGVAALQLPARDAGRVHIAPACAEPQLPRSR